MIEKCRPRAVEAVVVPDQVAAWAANVAPDGEVLHLLGALDPRHLSHDARLDYLVALNRAKSWIEAREIEALALVDAEPSLVADRVAEPTKRWREEELACALRVSRHVAARRLRLATALTTLPRALGSLAVGEISPFQATLLADATAGLTDAQRQAVEARVMRRAATQDYTAFRRSLTRAVASIAPDDPTRLTRDHRHVRFTPLGHGMTAQFGLLPAEDAAALQSVLDAMAGPRRPGDDRDLSQRRADALTQLALDRLGAEPARCSDKVPLPDLPRLHGRRPAITVTVAASTLAGLDDEPAELAGHGPIPAELARRLAADRTGVWRRLVTDDRGRVVRLGQYRPAPTYHPPATRGYRYRPSRVLTDLVIARDQRCRFPGCSVTATRCEIDHLVPYAHGGSTRRDNLQCLCRRHHHLKHEAGWRTSGGTDGTVTWTDPCGRSYLSRAPDLP